MIKCSNCGQYHSDRPKACRTCGQPFPTATTTKIARIMVLILIVGGFGILSAALTTLGDKASETVGRGINNVIHPAAIVGTYDKVGDVVQLTFRADGSLHVEGLLTLYQNEGTWTARPMLANSENLQVSIHLERGVKSTAYQNVPEDIVFISLDGGRVLTDSLTDPKVNYVKTSNQARDHRKEKELKEMRDLMAPIRVGMGVQLEPINESDARALGLEVGEGAYVTAVGDNTPAQAAGILSGDFITALDGNGFNGRDGAIAYFKSKSVGDVCQVSVIRPAGDGSTNLLTINVTLRSIGE